ncbi:UrcA family protein [Altererythrobacter sp. SALINAS58]|uniref:UrcA family protein n=1 Tax=Alteripontixanthobacter muriae TaxID=2705546 RepID=UPI001E562B85|nr:UrcA family protein [Alteripontixanthobacter muriae]NTZ42886.1 UrcA family protein [Alteripontixanthobacter muriae]
MNSQKLVCAVAAVTITSAAMGLILTPAAFAKAPIEVTAKKLPERIKMVSYADLNLATAAGERTLETRVRGAVRYVCDDRKIGHAWGEYQACRTFAWRGAEPQMQLAVRRAHDIAANGKSEIPAVALAILGTRYHR